MTDDDKAQADLNPCPFCGGEASFLKESGSYGYYPSRTGVQCENNDCHTKPRVVFADEAYNREKKEYYQINSKEKAIAAWNTRAADRIEALTAENERLREALERIAEDIWGEAYNVSQKRKYNARAALGCTK